MAGNSIDTLKALLAHAESERDAAQAALRRAQGASAQAEAQSGQLQQYRGDYRQRWSTQFAREGTAALLHHHHGFGQRLDQAIDQQRQQCEAQVRKVAQAQAVVQRHEMRLAAVRKLIERRLADLSRAADRRDQKQTDEAAQRAAWAARATADLP